MMSTIRYSDFTFSFLPSLRNTRVIDLINQLPSLDLDQRKSLIKLSRALIPDIASLKEDTQIYDQCLPILKLWNTDTLHDMKFFLNSPILSPILINLIRAAPFNDHKGYLDEKTKCVASEMEAHYHEHSYTEFDYGAIMDRPHVKIHPKFPLSYQVQKQISYNIRGWAKWATSGQNVFYPKLSKKRPSSEFIAHQLSCNYDRDFTDHIARLMRNNTYDQSSFEMMYVHSEPHSDPLGANEMRVKWAYADNKPRPYYAIGATDFIRSKSTRQLFQRLCDWFDPTHKTKKLDSKQINLSENDYLLMYDLKAFTTGLSELKFFLYYLATYIRELGPHPIKICSGLRIDIVDLSDVVLNYASTCTRPEFLLHGSYYKDNAHPISGYSSGLLGVYSNIVTSTLLHGFFATILSGDFNRTRVAGDDAIMAIPRTVDKDEVIELINKFGVLAPEKVFDTYWLDDPHKVYLKRPLRQYFNSVKTRELMTMMSLDCYISIPQYTKRPRHGIFDRIRSSMSGVRRIIEFLHALGEEGYFITHTEEKILLDVINFAYKFENYTQFWYNRVSKLRSNNQEKDIPLHGGIWRNIPIPNVAVLITEGVTSAFYHHPYTLLLSLKEDRTVILHQKDPIENYEGSIGVQSTFRANARPHFTYMVAMGILKQRPCLYSKIITDLNEYLHYKQVSMSLLVFEYTVLSSIPEDFIYEMHGGDSIVSEAPSYLDLDVPMEMY